MYMSHRFDRMKADRYWPFEALLGEHLLLNKLNDLNSTYHVNEDVDLLAKLTYLPTCLFQIAQHLQSVLARNKRLKGMESRSRYITASRRLAIGKTR